MKLTLRETNFGQLRKFCSDESIQYLKNSLRALEQGRPATPSFPLYGRRDASLLDSVNAILEKSSAPEWLIEYEHSRDEKFGPQGGHAPWSELRDTFDLYQTALKDVTYVDEEIIQDMQREYRALRCQELTAKDTLGHLIRTDKVETRAAGWPEFQLKKTDPAAQRIALKYASGKEWLEGEGYVFSRFNKQKRRIFMPMPFCSMIVQAKWFIPFLGNIQKSLLYDGINSPYLFWSDKIGFSHCFDLMEKQLNHAKLQSDEYIVYFSNDFEKMDTRTGTQQYESFFLPMLHAAFRNSRMDDATLFTTRAPIISPSGTMVGDHGTASGAEMTNGGETVCNDYFQRRFIKLMQDRTAPKWRVPVRRGNGDDSIIIFFVHKSCELSEFEDILREALAQTCAETGFDVQTEKLEISTTFGKYCQNVLQYDSERGHVFWTYPITLVTNSIVNPEHQYTRAQWDKDYRDIDVIVKLDNAVNHPAYHAFVDWVRAGMKYPLLGSSEPETSRILSKYDSYRALQSLGERYNRQDYEISSSPTVQYLLSKR